MNVFDDRKKAIVGGEQGDILCAVIDGDETPLGKPHLIAINATAVFPRSRRTPENITRGRANDYWRPISRGPTLAELSGEEQKTRLNRTKSTPWSRFTDSAERAVRTQITHEEMDIVLKGD